MADSQVNFETLLAQQQEFPQKLMQQQQKWMESILSQNSGENLARSGELSVCPPFPNFNKENQNWEDWKKAYFLSWAGIHIFELENNLFGSENLHQQTYEQITEKLTEHFKQKRHIVAARYEFFKRQMRDSQIHKEWVADLRGIARECQFVCQSDGCLFNYVSEMIRDQIIVHTPIDAIRTAASQKLQPSLEDVLSIAETYEATTKTVAVIKESDKRALDTNAVYTQKSNHQKRNFPDGKGGKTALKSCSGCSHTLAKIASFGRQFATNVPERGT